MKVFLSWSGTRSRSVALKLKEWIPLLLPDAEPWLSPAGAPVGGAWRRDSAAQLAAVDFGILCLTPDAVASPWIAFEAGALLQRCDAARVVPYCVDVGLAALSSGPIGAFRAVKADEEGTLALVRALNAAADAKAAGRPDSQLAELFELAWPELDGFLRAAQTGAEAPAVDTREVVESLVARVASLEAEIREQPQRTGRVLSSLLRSFVRQADEDGVTAIPPSQLPPSDGPAAPSRPVTILEGDAVVARFAYSRPPGASVNGNDFVRKAGAALGMSEGGYRVRWHLATRAEGEGMPIDRLAEHLGRVAEWTLHLSRWEPLARRI